MHLAVVPKGDAHASIDTDPIVGGFKLLRELRDLIRRKHSSTRTEQAYLQWVTRYILFDGKRHPRKMGEARIAASLNPLAVARNLAASTPNRALSALVILYMQALSRENLSLQNLTSAKRPTRLPTVFDRTEIVRLFAHLEGTATLFAALLYESGQRLIDRRLASAHPGY